MPLPNGGPWPPKHLGPVQDKLAVWSAWYSGDPEQLSAIYGGQVDTSGHDFFASEAGNGNLLARARRTIARWFWGTPTPRREQRSKLHVPIASDLASTSAKLLYAEAPKLTVDDKATQDRLDSYLEDGLHATLLQAGEVSGALGGVYLRVCWDSEISERPWLSAVHADAAVPEWRWDRLTAVTFWRALGTDGSKVVRHLERHEAGVILHGLYEGTIDELGRLIDLAAFPETAGLDPVIETRVDDRLTAAYSPNLRPNRVWRNLPAGAPLGRSDYQGVEQAMDALDETYTSWMRDIRLGKARLLVPDVYLEPQGRGQGARFDGEREVYETLAMMPRPDSSQAGMITPTQFEIRTEAHRDTVQHLTEVILRSAGYSVQTLGESREGEPTATEIRARERLSFTTRDLKIVFAGSPLRDIVETQLAVDQAVFGARVEPQRPDLEFGDSVSEDMRQLAETAQLLRAADAASDDTLVRMLHPEWDDKAVNEEVAKLQEQRKITVPDPASFGGDDGGQNEPPGGEAE